MYHKNKEESAVSGLEVLEGLVGQPEAGFWLEYYSAPTTHFALFFQDDFKLFTNLYLHFPILLTTINLHTSFPIARFC